MLITLLHICGKLYKYLGSSDGVRYGSVRLLVDKAESFGQIVEGISIKSREIFFGKKHYIELFVFEIDIQRLRFRS